MTRQDKINFERRRLTFAELLIGSPVSQPERLVTYDELATKAESLRKRYENACSYQWACTPEYEARTAKAEQRLVKAVTDLGLHAYLQTDPRGAVLYVDKAPIASDSYNRALCVFK